MSIHDTQQQWAGPQPLQQSAWEHQLPSARANIASGASIDPAAFLSQLEEIDRAMDNLIKSGRFFPGSNSYSGPQSRRDSMPVARHYTEPVPRFPTSEYDSGKNGFPGSGLQGYYTAQRFQQPPRYQEPEHGMHSKRGSVAAQRERELRNYHQEQQYGRHVPSSDGLTSPSVDGQQGQLSFYDQNTAHYASQSRNLKSPQDARMSASVEFQRQQSPQAYDSYGRQALDMSASGQLQRRDQSGTISSGPTRKSTSPSITSRINFGLVDSANGSTKLSSPATSPTLGSGNMPSIATQSGIAPIGSRNLQHTASGSNQLPSTPNERTISSASHLNAGDRTPNLGTWGSSSGVWGNHKSALAQASSVWA